MLPNVELYGLLALRLGTDKVDLVAVPGGEQPVFVVGLFRHF